MLCLEDMRKVLNDWNIVYIIIKIQSTLVKGLCELALKNLN